MKRASKAKVEKHPGIREVQGLAVEAEKWNAFNADQPSAWEVTRYGFIWRDHRNKILMRFERACSSRPGERRRWVSAKITTATETIELTVSPRKTHIVRAIRPKESKR